MDLNEQRRYEVVQQLARLAILVYEHRGYRGVVAVSWLIGIYTESCTINMVDRREPTAGPDPLSNDDGRAAKLIRGLVSRLEYRARAWTTDDGFFQRKPTRDPLLGAQTSLGFSLFGLVGAQVTLTCSVRASELRRYAERVTRRPSWCLDGRVAALTPAFDALQKDGRVAGPDLAAALAATPEALPAALAAAPRDTLRDAWRLADVDAPRGSLNQRAFVLFVHLVEKAQGGAPLPERLPLDLVPPGGRPAPASPSAATWPPSAPPEKAPESPTGGFVQVEI